MSPLSKCSCFPPVITCTNNSLLSNMQHSRSRWTNILIQWPIRTSSYFSQSHVADLESCRHRKTLVLHESGFQIFVTYAPTGPLTIHQNHHCWCTSRIGGGLKHTLVNRPLSIGRVWALMQMKLFCFIFYRFHIIQSTEFSLWLLLCFDQYHNTQADILRYTRQTRWSSAQFLHNFRYLGS